MGWKEGGGISIHFDQLPSRSRRSENDLMWHRPCEGDGFVSIMEDEVLNSDDTSLTILIKHFWHVDESQPSLLRPSIMPPLSQLICAGCRMWSLEVGFEGVEGSRYGGVESNCAEGCERYTIQTNAESSPLGMIDLNAEWRKAHPARLDFVEIKRAKNRFVYAILVEWQDGIAYRVQRPLEPLKLQNVRRMCAVTWSVISFGGFW